MKLQGTKGYKIIRELLSAQDRQPFLFQEETWQHIVNGESGLVNAPTGCGKTYSVFLGALIDFINRHPKDFQAKAKKWSPVIVGDAFARTCKGYWKSYGRSDPGTGYELEDRHQEW